MIDVTKLEAGHTLDELIAEKLMGWRKVPRRIINDRNLGPGWWSPHNSPDPENPLPGDSVWGIPGYSTDIAAAWEVVEKMRQDDPVVRFGGKLGTFARFCTELEQECGVKVEGDWETYGIMKRMSALSICRAALKAVGAGQ